MQKVFDKLRWLMLCFSDRRNPAAFVCDERPVRAERERRCRSGLPILMKVEANRRRPREFVFVLAGPGICAGQQPHRLLPAADVRGEVDFHFPGSGDLRKTKVAPTPGKCGAGAVARSVTRREAWADPRHIVNRDVRCGK